MNPFITDMDQFQTLCKQKLAEWYNTSGNCQSLISVDDVFVVWANKSLKNFKALLSTTVPGDGIYAEYTFNGSTNELYEDVYKKLTNTCHVL